jgi:hypothetical protein
LNILKHGNNAKEIALIWNAALETENTELIKEKSVRYIASQQGSVNRSVKKIMRFIN